ncbi:MAG: hypothetical protein JW760_13080 [Spirochaetales bacterium]|nr:hypothetical protein [Spirochaetales bacterium]
MKRKDKLRGNALILFFFFSSGLTALSGQGVLKDPLIPHGEWSILSVTTDDEESRLRSRVEIIGDRQDTYSVLITGPEETTEIKLRRADMTAFYLRNLRGRGEYSLESSTLVQGNPEARPGEIRILDTTSIIYALRGYPFSDPKPLRITFLSTGDESSDFELSVMSAGKENISLRDRTLECYRLELSFKMSGVFAVFSKMVPKTRLWYSAAPPHYLVKYQGQNGPPGTPMTTMEIREYSGWR